MRPALGLHDLTEENLTFARQIGVRDVVVQPDGLSVDGRQGFRRHSPLRSPGQNIINDTPRGHHSNAYAIGYTRGITKAAGALDDEWDAQQGRYRP